MNILIIYHRVDFDGLFGGAIAKKYYTEVKGEFPQFLGWNYGDTLPEIDYLNTFDEILMTDISFPPELMKKLCDGGKTAWVDHHGTAIADSEKYGYSGMPGIRVNGIAACELTWKFLYSGVACPKIIQYIGAYDVWNKDKFNWDEETLPIQYALRAKFELKFSKVSSYLNELITNQRMLNYLIACGKSILAYNKSTWKSWVKTYGFPVTVAGKYKGIALISPQFGSSMFESVLSDYDIYVVAQRKGPDAFSVSLYKEPDRLPEFNCGEYVAKTYSNGGGHPSACGCLIDREQFMRLITDGEI